MPTECIYRVNAIKKKFTLAFVSATRVVISYDGNSMSMQPIASRCDVLDGK